MELADMIKAVIVKLWARLWLHEHKEIVIRDLDDMTERLRIYMALGEPHVAGLIKTAWLCLMMAKVRLMEG